MTTFQDWEFADAETQETEAIQIETKEEAVKQAQAYANQTRHKCYVTTSIRVVMDGNVQDRYPVPGNPAPIVIEPGMIDAKPIRCPVCGDDRMVPNVIGQTEMWSCGACPAILFTYHDDSDITNLQKTIKEGW